MNYRIVKKHKRNEETAEIKPYFVIEKKIKTKPFNWFKKRKEKTEWIEFFIRDYYGTFTTFNLIKFDTFSKAVKYVNNLKKEIPKDEICIPKHYK